MYENRKISKALEYIKINVTSDNFPKSFVETGTASGDSIDWAMMEGGFYRVYTCELYEPVLKELAAKYSSIYFNLCRQNLMPNLQEFRIWPTDSRQALSEMLDLVRDPALIWLDAHPGSGCPFEHGVPLYKELQTIKEHCVKDHLIIIDDASYFGTKADQGIYEHLSYLTIEETLKGINPEYVIINTVTSKELGPFNMDMIFAIPPQLVNI